MLVNVTDRWILRVTGPYETTKDAFVTACYLHQFFVCLKRRFASIVPKTTVCNATMFICIGTALFAVGFGDPHSICILGYVGFDAIRTRTPTPVLCIFVVCRGTHEGTLHAVHQAEAVDGWPHVHAVCAERRCVHRLVCGSMQPFPFFVALYRPSTSGCKTCGTCETCEGFLRSCETCETCEGCEGFLRSDNLSEGHKIILKVRISYDRLQKQGEFSQVS